MLRDGSMAWEVKDFLVAQERCMDVTVEGQVFPGKAAKKGDNKKPNEVDAKKKSKRKTESKKPDLEGNTAGRNKQELWMKAVDAATGLDFHFIGSAAKCSVNGFLGANELVW